MQNAIVVAVSAVAVLLTVTPGLHAAETASFQVGDSGWHLGTIGVGNLDATPDLELVIPHRTSTGNWVLEALKATGEKLPGFPYAAGGEEMNVSPTLFDLDGDGRDEIFLIRGSKVVALRPDGSTLWSTPVDSSHYVPNGGYQTVTGGFYWYPSGDWLSHLPSTAQFSSPVSPPLIVDLTGRGNYELATAWKILPDPSGGGQDFNPFILPIYGVGHWGTMGETWSGGVVTLNATNGQPNSVYHLHHLLEAGLAAGRMRGSGALHIAALNDSDSVICFDKTQPFGRWGKGMLHGQFGKNQRLMTGSYQVPIDIYAADIDGDGLDEILVAGTQLSPLWQPNETILDDDGSILWRRWLPHRRFNNLHGWLNSASLIPCNPDHDNHVDVLGFNHSSEITFRYWNGAELVNRPGWPKEFSPLLPCPPVVGDVDGDGQEEIVIGTYDPTKNPSSGDLRIYSLDGTVEQTISVPGGVKHIPSLADVDRDGRLDVVYRSLNGRVSVQNFGPGKTNLISWATHRGNARRDGNLGQGLYAPGTPIITSRTSGFRHTRFSWTNAMPADLFRVYRAEAPDVPFQHVATFTGNQWSCTDYDLKSGKLYFYEVAAVYGTNSIRSAPFTILSLLNNNLVANSGFEQNDNCAWDKWYTGSVEMTNMAASSQTAQQGERSMRIRLQNNASGGTIAQFNQYGIPDSTIYTTPGAYYSFGGWIKSGDLSVPSEHWFELSSTKTGHDTNNRPALPYPLYLTPKLFFNTATSEWIYVNRTLRLPSGFPNLELRHCYEVASPVSGSVYLDNVFLRQLPSPSATDWMSLIPFGSQWRYFTNQPPTNWFSTEFQDTSWAVGTAKFGNGGGPTNLVTRLPQLRQSYLFRKSFLLGSAAVQDLLLAMTCTDIGPTGLLTPRVWLNGQEVKATIDTVSLQGNETRYFDLTPFADLLRAGTNLVAVLIRNTWSDYDDIAFDLSLKAVPFHPVLPKLDLNLSNLLSPSISVETAARSVWRLESADELSATCWQFMEAFTNVAGGLQTFRDDGQNSRPNPNSVATRLYRLIPY